MAWWALEETREGEVEEEFEQWTPVSPKQEGKSRILEGKGRV